MTVRQVFYQATVRGIIEKTEAGYDKVQSLLVTMRRDGSRSHQSRRKLGVEGDMTVYLEISLVIRDRGYSVAVGNWRWSLATVRYEGAAGGSASVQWVGPLRFTVRNLVQAKITDVL